MLHRGIRTVRIVVNRVVNIIMGLGNVFQNENLRHRPRTRCNYFGTHQMLCYVRYGYFIETLV